MNNVTIIDKNGNGILAEGVSYITINGETGAKNYVFYTLNETVENGLTKIYIAEEIGEGPKDVKLSDEEWANIKKIMVSILHAEDLSNITFNKMDGKTFNISEPKKLAIDLMKKQTLIDAQNTRVLADAQNVSTTEPAVATPFFNQEVTGDINEAPIEEQNNGINIFDNPLQPEVDPNSQPTPLNILSSDIPEGLGGIEDPTKVPISNEAVQAASVTPEVVEQVVPEVTQEVTEEVQTMDQTLVTSIGDVSAMPEENNVSAKPTMEEVRQALDILNRYFAGSGDLNQVVLTPEVPSEPTMIEQAVIAPEATVPEAIAPEVAVPPVAETVEVPTAPVQEVATPVVEAPVMPEATIVDPMMAQPVVEAPVAPVMEAPTAPVMDVPNIPAPEAVPVMEAPVAPVAPETMVSAPVDPMVATPVVEAPVAPVAPAPEQVVAVPEITPDLTTINPAVVADPNMVAQPVAPAQPVMEAPVAPVAPAAPAVPQTPELNTLPVQMPNGAVDPSMINTAGYEGLTVDPNQTA